MVQNSNNLETSKKLLPFGITGVVILVILLGFLLTVSQKNNPQFQPTILPAYPTAQPQIFANNNSNQFGSLVVTSDLTSVKVTIDENEVKDTNFFSYSNTPPFTIPKIPVGNHILRAKKEGYLVEKIPVDIKLNQLNNTHISMQIDPNFDNLRKAEVNMPVQTPEYNIDYLNYIGVVEVNIVKPPYENNKQKAVDWFKQHDVSDPAAEGVQFNDLTQTYVH